MAKVALNPRKKIPFKLTHRKDLSHNSRLFRFALQTPETKLGLPVGQHMFFYCKVGCCLLFQHPQLHLSQLSVICGELLHSR